MAKSTRRTSKVGAKRGKGTLAKPKGTTRKKAAAKKPIARKGRPARSMTPATPKRTLRKGLAYKVLRRPRGQWFDLRVERRSAAREAESLL